MVSSIQPIEVEVKLENLRVGIAEAQQVGNWDAYNKLTTTYVETLALYRKTTEEFNAAALREVRSQLSDGIRTLLDTLNVAGLKGEPITTLTWEMVPPAEGSQDDPSYSISFNVKVRRVVKATGTPKTGNGNGERRDLKALFEASASADDRSYVAELETTHKDDAKKKNSAVWAAQNRVSQGQPARPKKERN